MTFRPVYALAALALFAIEVVIALFVRDGFVRPYIGDVLAVMLVYAALRAVTRLGMLAAGVVALAVAVAIEVAQLVHVLDALGLGGNAVARVVFGGLFDWADLAAYGIGTVAAVAADRLLTRRVR